MYILYTIFAAVARFPEASFLAGNDEDSDEEDAPRRPR